MGNKFQTSAEEMIPTRNIVDSQVNDEKELSESTFMKNLTQDQAENYYNEMAFQEISGENSYDVTNLDTRLKAIKRQLYSSNESSNDFSNEFLNENTLQQGKASFLTAQTMKTSMKTAEARII